MDAQFTAYPVTLFKPTILVLMGGYWPGHEATGPNQSLKQLCAALCNEFHFKIVARDRPFGASAPLAPSGCWINHGFAQVRYCKVSMRGPEDLLDILRTTPHDILAMNGFFDREFTIPAILLRRFGWIPRKPAVLSTRGELADGALGLKAPRKMAYLALARRANLLRDIWLHGTGRREIADICQRFPWSKGILLAPNVRGLIDISAAQRACRDKNERCRLVFIGRIARVKNLAFALDVLRSVQARVDFDIYGPISEPDYWAECKKIIGQLPENVRVTHKGEIKNADIPAEISSASLLFLPTLGENFGHAIFEALSCEVPALISDQTPWQELEAKQAGWSLPLSRRDAFVAAIEKLAMMTPEERKLMRRAARALAECFVAGSDALEANRKLFMTVLGERANGKVGVRSAYAVYEHDRVR